MHREFTGSYIVQFVIEKDRMYTANANPGVKVREIADATGLMKRNAEYPVRTLKKAALLNVPVPQRMAAGS